MTFEEICSELVERGYSREQIREMDRYWAFKVIFAPRDDQGRLKSVVNDRQNKRPVRKYPFGPQDIIRRALWLKGCPEHLVEDVISAIEEQQRKLYEEAGFKIHAANSRRR